MSVFPEGADKLRDGGEESRLLAAVYQSESAWLTVSDRVTPEWFAFPANQALWTVLDELRSSKVNPAPLVVYDRLPEGVKKQLDEIGGWTYLESLGTLPMDPSSVDYHAGKLEDLMVLRRGLRAGESISFQAMQAKNKEEYLNKVEEIVSEIPGPITDEVVLLGSIAEDFVKKKAANPKEIPGLTSGYPILDAELQGFQPGRMYVLGARKKTGKSVWLLNLVKHMAVDNRIPVLYISTEQSQEDEVSRLLSMTAEVPERYLGNGTFVDMADYSDRMDFAIEKIIKAPIHFQHDPFFSLSKLRRVIKKYVVLHGVQCVFFDYIKIPSENIGGRDKWAAVGDLAYGLKACASEQNVPVITAVQVNRDGAESFKFTGDMDSDAFAQSDMIAQAMSVGMILRPLNKEEKEEYTFAGEKRILKITDNRHGASSYKGLFAFNNEIISLEERQRLDPGHVGL